MALIPHAVTLLFAATLQAAPAASAPQPGGDGASELAPEPEAPTDDDAPPSDAPPADAPTDITVTENAALRRELEALRARIEVLEQARPEQAPPTPAPAPAPRPRPLLEPDPREGEVGFGVLVPPEDYGLRLSGFVQVQYRHDQLSEDQLQQGGRPLNRDGFAVRRGRFRIAGDWRVVAFAFELDGSTTRGSFVGVRQAHVSALWRNPDATRPPYLMLTAGLTEIPFGYELRLPQRDMPFMERSTGSLALFPGPVDVGLRLRGGVGPFRYDLGVVNGSPLDDVAGPAGFDPTRRPDVAGRLGFEVRPGRVAIGGGTSFLTGTGLHAGQDATKNQIEWLDLNENGSIDTSETFAVPGTAAMPSVRYGRWAANADVQLGVRSKIGWSRLLAEVTLAQNLDRGLFISDPVAAGTNLRHVQTYAALLQDLTRWALVGVRYDLYDYDSDLLTRSRGRAVPADASIHTVSPLVGAVLPHGVLGALRGRLAIQYDVVRDALGRDRRGVPADLKNHRITVRVQVEF